jgi:hypothetical protein
MLLGKNGYKMQFEGHPLFETFFSVETMGAPKGQDFRLANFIKIVFGRPMDSRDEDSQIVDFESLVIKCKSWMPISFSNFRVLLGHGLLQELHFISMTLNQESGNPHAFRKRVVD